MLIQPTQKSRAAEAPDSAVLQAEKERFQILNRNSERTPHLRTVMGRNRQNSGVAGSVAPGVVGAPLYHDIARFQIHFLGVEHEHDFAFHYKTKFEGARLLHVRMRRR